MIYSDSADPMEVGRQWSRKVCQGMPIPWQVRERRWERAFLDLWFEDTVSRLWRKFTGYTISRHGTDRGRAGGNGPLAGVQPAEMRPPHDYSLSDYGFTEAGLKRTSPISNSLCGDDRFGLNRGPFHHDRFTD